MALTATTPRAPGPTAFGRAERGALVVWAVLVVGAIVWGTSALADADVSLRAAPLMGSWDWRPAPGLLLAVAIGGLVAVHGPALAGRVRWRALLGLTGATAVAWSVALAAADGWDRVTAPLTSRHEYEPLAAGIGDIGRFVAGFTDGLGGYPIHVQGHPPGPVVLAWALDRIGLGGAGWVAALALAAWGAAAAAALVCCRAVAGEAAARRAAPALAVLPAAVWAGTSLDALFAGLTAVGTALVVVAVRRSTAATHVDGDVPPSAVPGPTAEARRRPLAATVGRVVVSRPTQLAFAGGALLGTALLCSYGALPALAIALAGVAGVATRQRAPSASAPADRDDAAVRRFGVAVAGADGADTTARQAPADMADVRAGGRGVGAIAVRTGVAALPAGAAAFAGVAVVLAASAAAGFWWPDGLAATREAYWSGVAADRPGGWLTLVGNPAALALACGPAVAAGLAGTLARAAATLGPMTAGPAVVPAARPTVRAAGATVRTDGAARWAALLPAAALVVVAGVNLSQMSRGEVERIWLPFVPWLALAAPGDSRAWLAAQAGLALLLQSALRSPW